MARLNLKGQRFGRLTVLEEAGINKYLGKRKWLCRCVCGTKKVIRGDNLRYGNTKSCGCLQREQASKRMKEVGKANKGKNQIGENHSRYIDGRHKKQRDFYASIRERDGHKCVRCGKTEIRNRIETLTDLRMIGRDLEVHHKDHDHYNDIPENCETLCRSCHAKETKEYQTKQADLEYIEIACSV